MKNFIYIIAVAVMAASCNSPEHADNSKADANKARVQRFYDEVFNAHNIAMIDSFCTPDFVDHNPDPPHTGQGIEDLKATFTDFFTGFPDIHVTVNFMIAQGDTVMAHVTMAGTNSGAMGSMPATNKQVSINGIDIISLKDGKAVERWGIFDNVKMMEQLGVMPPPGAAGAMPDTAMAKTDAQK
jgi:steroid delta-isomerase-like uncharacterized protein